MKDFALNAWEDLREKRLWPLALILALALVAVPVLLLKGPAKPAAPPVAATGASGPAAPLVASDETEVAGSSKLGSFDPRDPFRSLAKAPRVPDTADPAAGSAVGVETGSEAPDAGGLDSGLGSSGSGIASAGGGSGSSSGGSGSGGGSSSAPSGSSGSPREPSRGSGGGSTPSPAPPTPPAPDPKFYEYAVEVDFGRVGDERRYDDVRALDALPRESNPVVVYLGQTRENESAFLVNQAVGQNGEGNCVPNKSDCSIVYLRPKADQDDHYFLTGPPNDFTYHLRLIAVRRKIDSRDASARSSATSSEKRVRTAGKRSKRTVRRTRFDFRIPMIAGRRR